MVDLFDCLLYWTKTNVKTKNPNFKSTDYIILNFDLLKPFVFTDVRLQVVELFLKTRQIYATFCKPYLLFTEL